MDSGALLKKCDSTWESQRFPNISSGLHFALIAYTISWDLVGILIGDPILKNNYRSQYSAYTIAYTISPGVNISNMQF